MAGSKAVTVEHVRQSFAHTKLATSPTDVIEYPGSKHWPEALRERLQSTLIPAGVLIPIYDRPDAGPSLLLTQRSAELKHHAGQISFPGGRMEATDADVAATALRETHEEVGIAADRVTVVGYLQPMPTITGYAVTPVIGLVEASATPAVDHQEVEFAFEVPLSFLMQSDNRRLVERELHGKTFPMVEFHYAGHRIWGATAMMIIEFTKTIINNKL